MESITNEKQKNTQNTITFPAISITLEEIRHLFDLEENRRQSLENKAGILMGIQGVIITIVTVSGKINIIGQVTFYILVIYALILGLAAIKLTKYKNPHKDYDDFYQYARMNEKKAMDKFLLNYITSTEDAENKNNKKAFYLQISFIYTIIAGIHILGWVIFLS